MRLIFDPFFFFIKVVPSFPRIFHVKSNILVYFLCHIWALIQCDVYALFVNPLFFNTKNYLPDSQCMLVNEYSIYSKARYFWKKYRLFLLAGVFIFPKINVPPHVPFTKQKIDFEFYIIFISLSCTSTFIFMCTNL